MIWSRGKTHEWKSTFSTIEIHRTQVSLEPCWNGNNGARDTFPNYSADVPKSPENKTRNISESNITVHISLFLDTAFSPFSRHPKKADTLIDDIGVEIIAMHYGIGWGKDKEYSHKI